MSGEETLATFILQVIAQRSEPAIRIDDSRVRGHWLGDSKQDVAVLMNLSRFIVETEENLTDLLPEGYRIEIKEWDE